MNKISNLLLIVLTVLYISTASSKEDQSTCYKAIDEYFDAEIKLKLAKFYKQSRKTIPLSSSLSISKKKVLEICPHKLANYAINVDAGDFFGDKRSKNKSPDKSQFCMSAIFFANFYLGYLETKGTPLMIEERNELNKMFEMFIDSNSDSNQCYKVDNEFILPLQEYFYPNLKERISKI